MNKKVVAMLLVVFCIIATIVISVFGKLPEDSYRTAVESIEFIDPTQEDDKCKLNSDGDKIIEIPVGTKEYQINYIINPSDATELDVTFVIINGAEYAEISKEGLITFTKEYSITVKIYSNFFDNKTDEVIILFGGDNVSIIPPDGNPFA
jgi:hypothetical protein